MRMRGLAGSCLALVMAAAGCKNGDKPSRPDSERPPEAPAVAEAKAVVQKLMEAARKGDVGAFKDLYGHDVQIDPEQVQPREFQFEVRDGWVENDKTVFVTAYMKDPQVEDARSEFLVTYRVERGDAGWKVTDATPRAAWEEDKP